MQIMKEEKQHWVTLSERSKLLLEIGAKVLDISENEFLSLIINCLDIDETTNKLKLNEEELNKRGIFPIDVIEIIKEFLESCFKQKL